MSKSSETRSVRPPTEGRKCKACLHPVKGHPGPFGLAKCKNMEKSKETANSDIMAEEIKELTTAFEAIEVEERFIEIEKSPKVVENCDKTNQTLPLIESTDVNLDINDSHFLSDDEEFAQKINDIIASLEESLVEDGNEALNHITMKLDIRSILSEGTYCICRCPIGCDISSCECEGELHLDCDLNGVVHKVFLDPLREFKEDLSPKVKCVPETWRKDSPNIIELDFFQVSRKGVKKVEGKICLEACLVENVGVVKGCMWMVMEVGKKFERNGLKSPVNFKPMEFQLVRLEEPNKGPV